MLVSHSQEGPGRKLRGGVTKNKNTKKENTILESTM